jgi:hypothetical protein
VIVLWALLHKTRSGLPALAVSNLSSSGAHQGRPETTELGAVGHDSGAADDRARGGLTELIDRLKSGHSDTFRHELTKLVEAAGEFKASDIIVPIALESPQVFAGLLDIMKGHSHVGDGLGRVAFHSVRRLGPKVLPALREEWAREKDPGVLARFHMCMMDVIGANAKTEELAKVAELEIPKWIEMLPQQQEQRLLGWVIWLLGELSIYAPGGERQQQVRGLLAEQLNDQNEHVRGEARRALDAMDSR